MGIFPYARMRRFRNFIFCPRTSLEKQFSTDIPQNFIPLHFSNMNALEKVILNNCDDEATITGFAGRNVLSNANSLIRFEEKKERYVWALPHEICFVISADHYVKSLIQCAGGKRWMSRHCTLKELLTTLPHENFIRLNKFYLLNVNYFSAINECEKILYLTDNFSIPVPHRISPYLRHLLKATDT